MMDTKKKKKKNANKDVKSNSRLTSCIVKLLIALVIAGVAAVIVMGVRKYFLNSEIFRVDRIEIQGVEILRSFNDSQVKNRYIGKSIFEVDARETASYLRAICPDIRRVTVKRVMPDRLTIDITVREPVALVKGGEYIPIDSEGVILENIKESGWKQLPVINGVRLSRRELKAKFCDSKNIQSALLLIASIRRSPLMSEHEIRTINANDQRHLTFSIDDGVEIRLGKDDYDGALRRLNEMLSDPNVSSDQIKYIDLRFDDSVIGTK
ncbi:MAG: cell division protein FtsQ/DivIB [Candidatus Omnitrophota bacterium]